MIILEALNQFIATAGSYLRPARVGQHRPCAKRAEMAWAVR